MRSVNTKNDLMELLRTEGARRYEGEGVTQLQHAWQCGRLARAAGASASLQLAAWLHDIGHLLAGLPGTPTLEGRDDRHQQVGADLLDRMFGPRVSVPVRLHVDAKRWLVARRRGYEGVLSQDSLRSLQLQGGPMGEAESAAFISRPHARAALQLRTWDDQAKVPGRQPVHASMALAELAALLELVPGVSPGRPTPC